MTAFRDILDGSDAYSASFAHDGLSAIPQARLVIVTCMDTRINPLAIFGLEIGQAHVLRNAGARVTEDVIRSLIKSINQLEVERIMVLHHTDCGAAKIKLDSLRSAVTAATGNDPTDVEFHLLDDADRSLAADVELLRTCPYFPVGTAVAGAMYDVTTGAVDKRHETFVG